MIVDFYVPEYNLVVEALGPTHFIHRENKNLELNLNSEFKIKCLKALNYKVITINYDCPTKAEGLSYEKAFLEQFKKICLNNDNNLICDEKTKV